MSSPTDTALADLLVERLGPVVAEAVERATRAALAEQAPKPAPRLLNVKEVQARLGCCGESVRRHVRSGKLVAVTALGALRFRPEDLELFIAGQGAEK